jgi:hypothetical protein
VLLFLAALAPALPLLRDLHTFKTCKMSASEMGIVGYSGHAFL